MTLMHSRGLVPVMLVTAAAFLYVNLFLLPATPFLMEGDQVYFWYFAQRLLAGDQVYRDFLQFTPPGTDLLYGAAFWLFGIRIWLPNAMDLVLGVAFCANCFALARRIMDRGSALLATFLFLIWVFAKALNGTHHWWSVLAILCAVLVAERSAVAAGALLGLSCFFTQTHGVFALLAYAVWLILTRQPWRSLVLAIASFAIVFGMLEAPYVASVGFARLWYSQITYSFKYVAHGHSQSLFGLPFTWHNLPNLTQRVLIDLALPVVYAIALWRSRDRQVRLLALVGAALVLEIALSPNWVRVYAIALPGVVLLVWLLPQRLHRWAWVVIAALAAQETIGRQRGITTIVDVPSGRLATVPETAEKLQWLAQRTRPGDYFFQGTFPDLYVPLRLHNPAFLSEITEDEATRREDVARSVGEIEARQVRYILWSPYNVPDARHPLEDHLGALRTYLDLHYRRVQVFSDREEIWERSGSSPAVTWRATTGKSLHD